MTILDMCLYMQISCKTIKLKSIKKNVKNYQIVVLVSKQGQLRQWMENYLNLWEKLYNNCEKFYILWGECGVKNKEGFQGVIGYMHLKPRTYTFKNQKVKFSNRINFGISYQKHSMSGVFLRQCLNSRINYTTSCDLIEIKN